MNPLLMAFALGMVIGVPLVVVLGGGYLGRKLGNATGGFLADVSTAMRLYGGPAGELASPLNVLEWASAGDVAQALVEEFDDETIALVLARLRPRFARRVRACLPAARHEWVDYWLAHPQPCPRRMQMAMARRLKRRLGLATTA